MRRIVGTGEVCTQVHSLVKCRQVGQASLPVLDRHGGLSYGPKKPGACPPLRGTLKHRRPMGIRGNTPVTQRNGVRADRAPLSTLVSAPSDPGAK